MAIRARPPTPAPTPMPAFAPVPRPEADAGVAMDTAVVDIRLEEEMEEVLVDDDIVFGDEELEEDDTPDLILNPRLDKTPLTKPFPVPV